MRQLLFNIMDKVMNSSRHHSTSKLIHSGNYYSSFTAYSVGTIGIVFNITAMIREFGYMLHFLAVRMHYEIDLHIL